MEIADITSKMNENGGCSGNDDRNGLLYATF